ncbi:MAG: hypothetical protein EPN88_12710 [Bacteroidetes bacterium]|nr:MAG: hypothetical protein EPN88_12710 [Bacteroidota bacterium]
MREIRRRSNRLTNDLACPFAVSGYEPLGETQNRQQLMINPIALCMATCRVNTQKSADGIVVPGIKDEGPNVEMSGASNDLEVGVESDRMSQTSARHGIAFPRSCLNGTSCMRCGLDLIWLRPDDFREPPIADPHDGWCGEGRLNAVPYPIYARIIPSSFSYSESGCGLL